MQWNERVPTCCSKHLPHALVGAPAGPPVASAVHVDTIARTFVAVLVAIGLLRIVIVAVAGVPLRVPQAPKDGGAAAVDELVSQKLRDALPKCELWVT